LPPLKFINASRETTAKMPAIDISLKDLAKKHATDAAQSIDWQPTGRRIKIKPDAEAKSSVIITLDKFKEVWVRGTVVAVGPVVGLADDGSRRETYHVGQRIIYNKQHESKYVGADGVEHIFLKENAVEGILAAEGSTAPVGEA
jgi:co-chaperonin GroES (HSP10)